MRNVAIVLGVGVVPLPTPDLRRAINSLQFLCQGSPGFEEVNSTTSNSAEAIPQIFGADKSQAVIGVQMASAYVGPLLMPPLFGVIAHNISVALLPAFLLVLTLLMVLMHEKVLRGARALAR